MAFDAELIYGHLCPVLVVSLVGIYDQHVQHSDLNSSHSVFTEVDVECKLKNVELNWSLVDLIEVISALCQR